MEYDNYDEDAIRRSRKRKSQLMKKKRQKILREKHWVKKRHLLLI